MRTDSLSALSLLACAAASATFSQRPSSALNRPLKLTVCLPLICVQCSVTINEFVRAVSGIAGLKLTESEMVCVVCFPCLRPALCLLPSDCLASIVIVVREADSLIGSTLLCAALLLQTVLAEAYRCQDQPTHCAYLDFEKAVNAVFLEKEHKATVTIRVRCSPQPLPA